MEFRTAGVIGAGAWGTALAQVCVRAGLETTLQAREPQLVETLRTTRANDLYLPGVPLAEGLKFTADLADLGDCDLILAVPPAQHMRATLTAFAPHHRAGVPVVLCSKGVERRTMKLMTEVLAETLPDAPAAVLSGPSFAGEVARGLPTAVTLACADPVLGQALLNTLSAPGFRPYLATDLIGAVAMGGQAETVAGLCGLGDLVLTCSSPQSRNMSLGLALGQGQTVEQALAGKRSVAEGYESAPAVRALAARLGVETPIAEGIAALLAGEITVDGLIDGLLSRPLKAERV